MDTILLQSSLESEEIAQLKKNFPDYNIRQLPAGNEDSFSKEDWAKVKIFFGHRLKREHLAMARDLHWIHCPSLSLSLLCLDEIHQRGNILITTANEENLRQIGEFVIGGILTFAKQFIYWPSAKKTPNTFWEDEHRRKMWTLQNKTLLQIGLGKIGTEIVRQAKQVKLNVVGVQNRKSFHPYCDHTVTMENFRDALPEADIVSVSLTRDQVVDNLLTIKELELMKEDSILIILGPYTLVNAEDLGKVAAKGKWRGILFDSWNHPIIPTDSPLWHIPQLVLTPEIAFRPGLATKQSFQLFHYNLRQFLCGNFADMRNKIEVPDEDSIHPVHAKC